MCSLACLLLHRHGMKPHSVELRCADLVGGVHAPFRIRDLPNGPFLHWRLAHKMERAHRTASHRTHACMQQSFHPPGGQDVCIGCSAG